MSRTITIPDWINEEFLQIVLKQDEYSDKGIKILSMDVAPAVSAGDNYVSLLLRVKGEYQIQGDTDVKEVSIIVKTMTGGYLSKFFEEFGFGSKEYNVFTTFLPEIYRVLKTKQFAPRLLYSPDPATLVFEDLKWQGFVMADRLKQLDYEHCSVFIKTLARFHAASVAVIKQNPTFIETIGKEIIYDKHNEQLKEKNKEILRNISQIFTTAVETWDGFEDFKSKTCRIWETIIDDLCDVFGPREDSLNVMNHGDVWTNNMMFKYDSDGNIIDYKLLDFQVCRYGTPATDLQYFLCTSASEEVRETRMDELISEYLKTLNYELEELGCEERLTGNQLETELKKTQCYIFAVTHSILPSCLGDPDNLVNLDDITEDNFEALEGNPFEKSYYGKYYKKVAPQVLRYLEKNGFFERYTKQER